MKKVQRILAIFVVFAFVFTVSAPAVFASDKSGSDRKEKKEKCDKHKKDGKRGVGAAFGKILSELDLTDKQNVAIKKMKLEYEKNTIKIRAEKDILDVELKGLLMADRVDLNAAEAKLMEIAHKEVELKLFRIKKHEKLKSLLTKKQRKEFEKKMPMMMHGGGYGSGDHKGKY
ncbi:MAG: Spy/CpxP family protein refolding chaperone [Deltaproteobacteria bacterium]|nr:Spy/CpxP family protein refolding chaperone [Deltaproteobacteria bacterium]